MPLVTLTCKRRFFPPDNPRQVDPDGPIEERAMVVSLAESLPWRIVSGCRELNLGIHIPEEGVQVDIRRFHPQAVNAVDVWMHVVFTESLSEQQQLDVREMLTEILKEMAVISAISGITFSWAVDVFFGSGHGCLSNTTGSEVMLQW